MVIIIIIVWMLRCFGYVGENLPLKPSLTRSPKIVIKMSRVWRWLLKTIFKHTEYLWIWWLKKEEWWWLWVHLALRDPRGYCQWNHCWVSCSPSSASGRTFIIIIIFVLVIVIVIIIIHHPRQAEPSQKSYSSSPRKQRSSIFSKLLLAVLASACAVAWTKAPHVRRLHIKLVLCSAQSSMFDDFMTTFVIVDWITFTCTAMHCNVSTGP